MWLGEAADRRRIGDHPVRPASPDARHGSCWVSRP